MPSVPGPRGRFPVKIADLKTFLHEARQQLISLEGAIETAERKGATELNVGNVKSGRDGLELLASFYGKILQAVLEYRSFNAIAWEVPPPTQPKGAGSEQALKKRGRPRKGE